MITKNKTIHENKCQKIFSESLYKRQNYNVAKIAPNTSLKFSLHKQVA